MERIRRQDKQMIFSSGVMIGKDIWFIGYFSKNIMRLDTSTWEVFYMPKADGYQPEGDRETDVILYEDGIIYRLGIDGKNILIYNVRQNLCDYISIPYQFKPWGNFAGMYKCKENLYIFCCENAEIIIVDLASRKTKKVNLNDKSPVILEDVMFLKACRVSNVVWLFPESLKFVVSYDMGSEKAERHPLNIEAGKLVDVTWKDGCFYILDSQNKVIMWDFKGGTHRIAGDFGNDGECEYGKLVVTDKTFMRLPGLGQDILLLDREKAGSQKGMVYDSYPSDFGYFAALKEWSKYLEPCEDADHYYYSTRVDNYLLIISKKTGQIDWIRPTIANEKDELIYCPYSLKDFASENFFDMLDDFIVTVGDNARSHAQECDDVGRRIWTYLKN